MTEDTRRPPALSLVVIIAVTVVVAALGGLVSAGSDDAWYAALNKPPLNPPDVTFAIVWPVLYVLMALGAIGVRLRAGSFRAASAALGIFFVQLGVNLSWSWVFFGFHQPLAALAILLILWLLIVTMIVAFWRHARGPAMMQLPYLAWVSFAGYLNAYIVLAN